MSTRLTWYSDMTHSSCQLASCISFSRGHTCQTLPLSIYFCARCTTDALAQLIAILLFDCQALPHPLRCQDLLSLLFWILRKLRWSQSAAANRLFSPKYSKQSSLSMSTPYSISVVCVAHIDLSGSKIALAECASSEPSPLRAQNAAGSTKWKVTRTWSRFSRLAIALQHRAQSCSLKRLPRTGNTPILREIPQYVTSRWMLRSRLRLSGPTCRKSVVTAFACLKWNKLRP